MPITEEQAVAVAEKVFGWKQHRLPPNTDYGPTTRIYWYEGEEFTVDGIRLHDKYVHRNLDSNAPTYQLFTSWLTDHPLAVLAKMEERGWFYEGGYDRHSKHWQKFWKEEPTECGHRMKWITQVSGQESPVDAILAAARAAVESEEKRDG